MLSFGAALGLSALIFEHVLGFEGADPGVSSGARDALQQQPAETEALETVLDGERHFGPLRVIRRGRYPADADDFVTEKGSDGEPSVNGFDIAAKEVGR